MRTTYVWDPEAGCVVPKGTETRRNASGLTIIRDFAEPIVNPADGQAYSTRPAYEAATRRAGAVEIGHAEHRKLREGYEGRGRRRHETGPTVAQSIREALERTGG